MELCPVNPEWIHTFLVEPYLQGCELCNLAWRGEDYSLVPKQLSWQERAVCWLQGTSLMLFPFVNTIIWLAWQTFGSPEKLADKFAHDPVPSCRNPHPQPDPIQIQNIDPDAELEQTKAFSQMHTHGNTQHRTDWVLKHYSDCIVAEQSSDYFLNTAIYTPDFLLKTIHYNFNEKHITLTRNQDNPKLVELIISKPDGVTQRSVVELEEDLPCIQQRIGLRNFVQSDDEVMYFYGVVPEYPSWVMIPPFVKKPPYAMKMKAIKKEIEDVPGFGRLQKIELSSTWSFPYSIFKAEMWFDPTTCELKTYRDTAGLLYEATGTVVQNDRSLE